MAAADGRRQVSIYRRLGTYVVASAINGVVTMKIKRSLPVLLLVLCAGLMAGYLIYHSDWFQKKYVYPFPFQEKVFRYATEYEVDPYLIVAVVRTESKFLPAARSPKGARGLMQMMPETGQWVAGELNVGGFTADMLSDPETNIRFGTWYLASLRKEFKNNDVLVLAAYNGGRGNVKQWMRQLGWSDDFRDVDTIPYRETREYVRRVIEARERYQELYGQ